MYHFGMMIGYGQWPNFRVRLVLKGALGTNRNPKAPSTKAFGMGVFHIRNRAHGFWVDT